MEETAGVDGANALALLAQELSNYDTIDLSASVAALQIMPQNLDCLARLEVLSHVVASIVPTDARARISPHRLKRICNTIGVGKSHIASQDDPCNELLTEAVPFFGQEYLVFPGMTEYATSTLQGVIYAIFSPSSPFTSTSFYQRAYPLVRAALVMSDAVARRAGLVRGIEPIPNDLRAVEVPAAPELDGLKQAVRFARTDLEMLLASYHVSLEDLADLMCSAGSFSPDGCEPGHGPLSVRPVVCFKDSLVMAVPGLLPSALSHALVLLALKHGVGKELAHQINGYWWNSVLRSLNFLDADYLHTSGRVTSPSLNLREGFFQIDADKTLYALLVTEDWHHYSPESPFGNWPSEHLLESVRERISTAVEYHERAYSWSKRLFIVFLVQTTGRSFSLSADDVLPLNRDNLDFLRLTVPELDVLSVVETGNVLALWKFARAWDRLRQHTVVLSWSHLDAYYFYREHKHSFYFNDERRPNMVNLDPGYSGDLRREVHQKRDAHFVLSPDRLHVSEVISYRGDRRLPLYAPPRPVDGQIQVLVEGLFLPIWLSSSLDEQAASPGLRRVYFMLVDTISYWLWRFAPDLSPILEEMGDLIPNLRVDLLLPAEEDWETMSPDPSGSDGTILEYEYDKDYGAVGIIVHRPLLELCATADNRGERELMAGVLNALSHLLPTPDALSEDVIASILDRHAPLGTQKMALLPTARSLILLDDTGLPDFRKIQEADVEELLDELGSYLTGTQHLRAGEIPEEDCVALINTKIVPFFYQEFCRIVNQLSPEGLLENLVSRHESVLQQQQFLTFTTPTRLACFGFDTGLEERIHREQYETDTAAVMNRFLIEYVVAQPPQGTERLSTAAYDRLLALARQIVYYGFASDILNYKLARLRFAMLGSGRLGEDRKTFDATWRTYNKLFSASRVRAAQKAFNGFWPDDVLPDEPPTVGAEDSAMRAEFGYSLTEMAEFLHWMVAQGLEQGQTPACLPLKDLVGAFAAAFSWGEEKAACLIALFSLRARAEFLAPPGGFMKHDIWPWRFNRRISYLRLPILIREHEGQEEAVWGPKHAYKAGAYFVDLLLSGRLPPARGGKHSPPMRNYQSRRNNARGKEFEQAVIDILKNPGFLSVRGGVKQLGNLYVGQAGEIDAIVANPKKKCVFVLECKALSLAKTPYEMGQQICHLHVDEEGQKSATSQALTKAAWIKSHLAETLNELRVATPATQWKVKPLIVTDARLLTAYLINQQVPIVPVEELLSAVCQ